MAFKDIKGQDKPIRILKGYLQSGNLQGTYLFTGEEGLGKLLAAENFAKAANCLELKVDCCDHCASCVKINKREHPDLHFVDLDADTIKIECVRQIKKEIALRPYEARLKFFIINNAHNLNAESANALLKVLEEPPGKCVMILVTAKPALLFKTIISRCKIIKFTPLKRDELEEVLKKDYSLKAGPAHFLAYFCEGKLGYALRFKEQDILTEKNRIIDTFTVPRNQSLEQASVQSREELRAWLNILAGWFRDIYLLKIGMPQAELINLDRKEDLLKNMHRYTLLDIDGILKSISDSMLFMEQNVNIKLLLSHLKVELWKN